MRPRTVSLVCALAACLLAAVPAAAQEHCPATLEGRWIDDASSIVKGKPDQTTGFILRRQGEGYYLTTLIDFGAKAVPRGYFTGSAAELLTLRVLGYDDLSRMFAGTVVGPLAVDALADQRIPVKRIYRLAPDGKTVAVSGDGLTASVQPNGTLRGWSKSRLSYPSARARFPEPCAGERRAAGWEAFKARANAWRDAKEKPPMADEVRQRGMLGIDAVNAKNFDRALDEFESGLAIDALWPNGHYNAAMVSARMMDYPGAIHHMKAYLELCPTDDKEWQANTDRLLLWEGKLKQQMEEPPQPGPGKSKGGR